MFELRINGQKVWSSERQVTRVSMQSDRGEIGSAGISPTDGVIDIYIEEVQPGGPTRLDEVERARHEEIKNTPEGTGVGLPAYAPDADANKPTQGVPSRDVPPGGPDLGEKPNPVRNQPEVSPTGSVLDENGAVAVPVNETGAEEEATETPVDENQQQNQTAPAFTGGGMPGFNVPGPQNQQ